MLEPELLLPPEVGALDVAPLVVAADVAEEVEALPLVALRPVRTWELDLPQYSPQPPLSPETPVDGPCAQPAAASSSEARYGADRPTPSSLRLAVRTSQAGEAAPLLLPRFPSRGTHGWSRRRCR